MELLAGILVGVAFAAAGAALVVRTLTRPAPDLGTHDLQVEVRRLTEEHRRVADEALTRLSEANRALLEQERLRSSGELDGKKALIDQQLGTMTSELGKVGQLVKALEADRRTAFGELANELQRQHEGLNSLTENTRQLREALASQKVRGQWGERMAEDVLRLAGFLEGVNYRRQATLAGSGGRPDYTFLLPNGLVMHMDVKFPLDNYLRFLEAESDLDRRRHRDQFLRDVRDRVRELTTRGYLDATTETVDCLLLFIPNEQVYAFVQEHDHAMLDEALRSKIVLCSPLTLFAVLAVVRQAVDNFRLERTSNEILGLLGEFSRQWEKYVVQLDKVQARFDGVAKEYTALMSVRHRALQRPLDKIETLRHEEQALVEADITPFAVEG
ncbi:MAG: DNA recombination protein RmuC [Acidimicrobiia bacterium]